MASRNQSPRTVRIVGGLLAAVWLVAGIAAIGIAVFTSHWFLAVIGVAAVWYGTVWIRAARQGRLLTAMEAFTPWRVKSHSDT